MLRIIAINYLDSYVNNMIIEALKARTQNRIVFEELKDSKRESSVFEELKNAKTEFNIGLDQCYKVLSSILFQLEIELYSNDRVIERKH